MSMNTSPLNEPTDTDIATDPVEATNPPRKVEGSAAGGTWVGLIVGAILLIILLTFILQNQEKFDLHMFAWSIQLPIGAGMLLSAILGALIMAVVGGVRILQLRRQVRRG